MIYDQTLPRLDGGSLDLGEFRGRVTLLANVASECGLTPQYEGLQWLYERYADRGLAIVGVPCNQFGEQEPGSAEEIADFCGSSYGITFPLTGKLDVNGPARHPLYAILTAVTDGEGEAGDVRWNFEKFLISRHGQVLARFRPLVAPALTRTHRRHRSGAPQPADLNPERRRVAVVAGTVLVLVVMCVRGVVHQKALVICSG